MSFAMSRAEREQFLARAHVGVLSLVDSGKPLSVPVWYGYEPGGAVTARGGWCARPTGEGQKPAPRRSAAR